MELICKPLTVHEVLVQSHLMTSISEVGDKDFTPISYAHVIEGYFPVIQVFYWLHIISSFGNRNQGNFDGYAGS